MACQWTENQSVDWLDRWLTLANRDDDIGKSLLTGSLQLYSDNECEEPTTASNQEPSADFMVPLKQQSPHALSPEAKSCAEPDESSGCLYKSNNPEDVRASA